MAGQLDITGQNPFGGARLIGDAAPPVTPEEMMALQQPPPQQQAGATLAGIDPAVAAKLFAPVEEVPYGY